MPRPSVPASSPVERAGGAAGYGFVVADDGATARSEDDAGIRAGVDAGVGAGPDDRAAVGPSSVRVLGVTARMAVQTVVVAVLVLLVLRFVLLPEPPVDP